MSALDLTTPGPLKVGVDAVSAKTPIGAKLRSKDWQEKVALGLAEDAFMSAGVESVRVLDEIQKGIGKILSEVRDARTAKKTKVDPATGEKVLDDGGFAMDRGKWIRDTQRLANSAGLRNVDPEKRGGLEDFGSERRLKLILEQQIGAAQSKAFWEQGNDPDLLAAFPALRLIRVRASKVQRDWDKRWKDAAEAVNYEGVATNGEKVALKSSNIWRELSRFGRPYPPFDFNSGKGVEEVSREETDAMGLTSPGERIGSGADAWREDLEASVKTLSPESTARLQSYFGEQLTIADGMAKWKRPDLSAKTKPAKGGTDDSFEGAVEQLVAEGMPRGEAEARARELFPEG